MNQLKFYCYDILLKCVGSKKLVSMPRSSDILASLGEGFKKSLCSDLFTEGFSYKPVYLASNLSLDYNDYKLLKTIKSATYISDRAKNHISGNDLISLIKSGDIYAEGGYICYVSDEPSGAVTPALLPDNDMIYGIRLAEGKSFRFFIKSQNEKIPEKLEICTCPFTVEDVRTVSDTAVEKYVLQCELQISDNIKINDASGSRYKVSYDPASKKKTLLPGSVICRKDLLTDTVDFIPSL